MEEENFMFGKFVINNKWKIIVVSLIFLLIVASGARFLTYNRDNRVFFSKDNPQLAALEKLESTYTRVDNIYIIISPKDGNVFTRKTLSAIEEITEASWKIPFSTRVDSLTNFQSTRSDGDDLIVEDLFEDSQNLSEKEMERKKATALADPDLLYNILAPEAHTTLIEINVIIPGKESNECEQVALYTRKMIKEFKTKYPNLDIYLSGRVMFDNAFGEVSKDDVQTLVPIMLVLIILVVGFGLRSTMGVLTTLIIILFSIAAGMGMAGWFRYSINVASATAPTIILTLAVADSVHILVSMFLHMRSGNTKEDSIIESLRINMQPVFLTSLTTAIGFLSMNFSDAPPFRDLGNIVAMGIFTAYLYSVFFLPALLAVLPIKFNKKLTDDELEKKSFNWLASFVIKRKKILFYGTLFMVVILSFGLSRIYFSDNFIGYFSERYPIRRATEYLKVHLRGWDVIEYSLDSGEEGGVSNPEFLKKVEEFAEWYKKQPQVGNVVTVVNKYKRLNRDMNGGNPDYWKIPDDQKLAAQYLLLYEMSLPFGHDMNNMINVKKSSTRMIVFLRQVESRAILDLNNAAEKWLRENAPLNMQTKGSGLSLVWANISARNIVNMLWAAFGALVLISIILLIVFRDIKLGVISLIPNLIPAFAAFGIWGIFVRSVNLGLSVVVAMTLGVVVDDTIHFMSKYLRAKREYKMNSEEAVRFSFNTVGKAMWITTLSLICGFLVLTFSGYQVNAEMGLVSALTITMALYMDFLFLPTILMKFDN